jgi:hypothetical protein
MLHISPEAGRSDQVPAPSASTLPPPPALTPLSITAADRPPLLPQYRCPCPSPLLPTQPLLRRRYRSCAQAYYQKMQEYERYFTVKLDARSLEPGYDVFDDEAFVTFHRSTNWTNDFGPMKYSKSNKNAIFPKVQPCACNRLRTARCRACTRAHMLRSRCWTFCFCSTCDSSRSMRPA